MALVTIAVLPAVIVAAGPAGASTVPTAEPPPFCGAMLAMEASANSDDPAQMGPAAAALEAATPAELADTVATMLANAPTDGPPTPEFNAAYGEVAAWIGANCGYAAVEVLATDYAFGGLPPDLPAGPTVVTFENGGTEVHEILVLRRNDGVTETFEELIALPEEEARTMVTMVIIALASPGETSYALADLTAGDYLAICFIPTGITDLAAAPDPSAPPPGPPHFVHGMLQEFTVA